MNHEEIRNRRKQLEADRSKLVSRASKLRTVIEGLEDLDKNIPRSVLSDQELTDQQINLIDEEVKKLQIECSDHKMVYDGHTSHQDCYVCEICGKVEWE